MASSTSSSSANNKLSLILLLTLLSSSLHTSHSRDSQFFNKVSATTNNNNLVPDHETKQQPDPKNNFIPEINENGYGLYDHSSGQLPPSTTSGEYSEQPLHNKYLPKNYNPVAYVTQPDIEDNTFAQDDKTTFTTSNPPYDNNYNNNYYYNGGAKNYYNNKQQEPYSRSYPKTRNNYYYNKYDDPQGRLSDDTAGGFRGGPTFSNRDDDKYFNNGRGNNLEPQGMSDTRLLENGKYFYDVNTERYSSGHPYERLRRARNYGFNDVNNGNSGNAYEFNNGYGYQNQEDQFQDSQGNDLP